MQLVVHLYLNLNSGNKFNHIWVLTIKTENNILDNLHILVTKKSWGHFKSTTPPRYNWNIVESGVKHHKPNIKVLHLQCQYIGVFHFILCSFSIKNVNTHINIIYTYIMIGTMITVCKPVPSQSNWKKKYSIIYICFHWNIHVHTYNY